jgi:hypothetical protein
MIYDCCTFFNEYDILELRIKELYHVVDTFVIVEGTHTHKGIPKDANFLKHQERYKPYLDKIKFFYMDNLVDLSNPWAQETKQRETIYHALKQLNVQEDDLIILSDCDEIVNPDLLQVLRLNDYKTFLDTRVYHLSMLFFNYDYETLIPRPWGSAYLCLFKMIEASYNGSYTPANNWHFAKNRFASEHLFYEAGCHFSYFGNIDKIKEKLSHYAHQELNTEAIVNDTYIQECITNKKAMQEGDTMVHIPLAESRKSLPKNIDILVDAAAAWKHKAVEKDPLCP